jgi:excisionase family DNA binding protein
LNVSAKKTATSAVTATANGTKTIIEIIAAKTSAFPLREFATLTGIAYTTAYDMVKDGRLSAMWVGGSIRLDPKKTAEYLRQHETV